MASRVGAVVGSVPARAPATGWIITSSTSKVSASSRTCLAASVGRADDPAVSIDSARARCASGSGSASASSTVRWGASWPPVRSATIECRLGSASRCGLLGRVGDDGVDGEEGARAVELLGGAELRAVELQRLGGAVAGEVVGEDVRQALARPPAAPSSPRSRAATPGPPRWRRGVALQRVRAALHLQADPAGAHHRDHVVDVRREAGDRVLLDPTGPVAQRPRGDGVRAGGPADAEVDATGEGGLEQRELLGHHQRGVVGQHHAARPDPDPRRGGGQHRDHARGGLVAATAGMLWCSATQ